MNNITYAVSVDVNNPIIPYNVYVASVLDSNVRYLEVTLYENGNVITLSNTATATASLVTDNVLVNGSVNCTISHNIITVPLEDLQRHGNLDVQVTVTEGTKVLAIPFPIQVRVTPNIAENAQIDENSLGSYAEVVHEIVEARGTHTTLHDAITAKLSAAPGAVDTENLADESITVEKVADDLAAVINAKEVKSNKKTTLTGNESSNDFYPTTKAVADALNTKADSSALTAKADVTYVDNRLNTKADVTYVDNRLNTKADVAYVDNRAEEVGDLKSTLNGTVDLLGDTTIYNVSLAESGTAVGAHWNHYYDISLPKGTKLNFYLSAYTGVLFTNVLVRFYDTTNTLRSLAPSVMQTGKLQTYTLFEDCTRIWVQINRSAPENGVSAQFIMSFDTSGLSADVAKIQSVLPINSEEVLRSDILKCPNLRFKNDNSGGTETAGSDGWVVSDYIPVGLGLTVTGFSYSPTRPGIVEYNFAKTPIGTVTMDSSSKYVTKTYTPPSRVGYVRIQTITSIGNDTNAVSIINSTPKIFHVEKDGSGDFTKLSDAINEAVRYMDSTVYVGRGTWNIIDELGVGTDYIVSSDNRGLVLKNRVKVICASDSKITCNYTGSDSDTITWLSAFNAGPLGFTLENATIESSKCRYSVHDERDTDSDSYNNYYINCRMTHDNTNGGYNQCIGGGLGLDGHVIIDGCIFENPARTNYQIVYYHNSAGSGKSFVEVKGSYFKGTNTLGFQWYGSSPATQKSTLFAHGNSLGSAIQHTGASGAMIENTEVVSFNNEIRPSGADGQQGPAGADWVPTETELNNIAQRAVNLIPTTQGVQYGNTSN